MNFKIALLLCGFAALECSAQVPTDFHPKPTLNHPLRPKMAMGQTRKPGLRMGAARKADAKRLKAYLKKRGK